MHKYFEQEFLEQALEQEYERERDTARCDALVINECSGLGLSSTSWGGLDPGLEPVRGDDRNTDNLQDSAPLHLPPPYDALLKASLLEPSLLNASEKRPSETRRVISDAISLRGRTRLARPARVTAPGMPHTTLVGSSWTIT